MAEELELEELPVCILAPVLVAEGTDLAAAAQLCMCCGQRAQPRPVVLGVFGDRAGKIRWSPPVVYCVECLALFAEKMLRLAYRISMVGYDTVLEEVQAMSDYRGEPDA